MWPIGTPPPLWPLLISLLFFLIHSPTQIRANGAKPIIREHPLDVLVDKNDPATLRCNVSGDDVQIAWFKDDQPVNVGNAAHRLVLPNGSLFLLRADHDLGTYHCTATNPHGTVQSQSAHVRQASLREEFRVRPRNVNAVLGKNAVLECSGPRGFPEPSISWRKDDRPVQENKRVSVHPNGNLVIEEVQRSDSGLYTCVAMNMVGERLAGPARLSVSEKPRFLTEPKEAVGEVNSSIIFDCRVAGEPQPTVSWKKRNCVPLDEYSKCSDNMPIGRAFITEDSRGLRIERVQPQDEGEYVCVAKNNAGEIESSAKLRVNSPPTITRAPDSLHVQLGDRATFECETSGRPKPGVFWSKEGEPLFTMMTGNRNDDGRIEVTDGGTLIISNVRSRDRGTYVCAAVNSAGSTLKKADLTMDNGIEDDSAQPPLIIYGPAAQTLLVHDIAILPCQTSVDDSEKPPTVAWFHDGVKVEADSRIAQTATGTLRISDLRKSDTGNYSCLVENEYGTDRLSAELRIEEHNNPNAVFGRMSDKSALPAAPAQLRLVAANESGIELQWSAPTHYGDSPITHYTVQYWCAIGCSGEGSARSWLTVADRIPTNGFTFRGGIRSGDVYYFIVRANNAAGMGEPSTAIRAPVVERRADAPKAAAASPVAMPRSVGTVKLNSAKTINVNSALLSWSAPNGLAHDGFYLKWRGPPLANGDTSINITQPKSTSLIVDGLKPFSSYDFFLIPYAGATNLSPSNSIELLTPEGIPAPPRNVFARMENLTSVMIAFSPPAAADVNGVLRGFDIRFVDNSSSFENTIRTKANARSITLRNMRPGSAYQAHIATLNTAGRSEFASTELFTMNDATLRRHQKLYGEIRRPTDTMAFRMGVGAAIAAALLFTLIGLVFWCKRSPPKKSAAARRNCAPCDDFANIKINDGSVVIGGREEYWPESSMPFHLPPPPGSGMIAHGHSHPMPQLSSPRSPYFHPHAPCCPAAAQMMYGTTARPHYSGPYMSSTSTLAREEGQYHYAVLPNTLPSTMMTYDDDPSPYASTTIATSGYGPPVPSNPIPPPPALFAHPLHQHQQQSTNSMRRTTSGRRTPRTNPHMFTERSIPGPAPMAADLDMGRILAQVKPPMTTYDSVTDELSVPNYADTPDMDERQRQLPNRVLNSRSPPRTMRSANDESEEGNLLR